jgi:tetratricopeptide (TPR) repeat protein
MGSLPKKKFLATIISAFLFCPPLLAQQPAHPNPKAIAEHGQLALAAGEYATAEHDFNQLLKLGVRSPSVYSNLGVVYLRTGRVDEAIRVLLKAKALAPGVPGIRLNLGLAYFRKREFKMAAPYFGDVLASDPANLQAHYLKGLCHFMMDDLPAAIASFEPIQDREQDDLEFLFMLGTSYGMVKRTDDSRRIFERLVAAGGDTPHLHLLLGKAYLALNQLEPAETELRRAAEANSLPYAHYYLARLYEQKGDLALAISEWEKEIAVFPENIWAYKELAKTRQDRGETPAAIALLEKGTARNPDSPDLLTFLARAYLQSSDAACAIPLLKRALALDPGNGSTHFQLGRAYQASGHPQEAQSEMAKARTLMKENSEGKMEELSRDRVADSPPGEHQ